MATPIAERAMTCVFPINVRELSTNPHRYDTPFGRPSVVHDGDALALLDAYEKALREIDEQAQAKTNAGTNVRTIWAIRKLARAAHAGET